MRTHFSAIKTSIEFPIIEIFLEHFYMTGHLLSIHDGHGGEDKLIDFDNKSLDGQGSVNHENIGADIRNGSKVCIN